MKIIFIIFIMSLSVIYSFSQNYDDILMPSINPNYENVPFPNIILPPVNSPIPTQGNGSIITSNSGFRANTTTTITDFPDVVIYPSAEPQTEPHLTINKNHPNNIIISCNYNYAILFDPNIPGYVSYKHDQSIFISDNFNSPNSWVRQQFYPPGGLTVWGDPSTTVDAEGNLMVSTINSNADDYWINKSTDLGLTWLGFPNNNPLDGNASGPFSSARDFDKEMIVSDNSPSSPYKNNIYSAWMDYTRPPCSATYPFPIKFNLLDVVNGASTFSTPIYLSNRYGQGVNIKTSSEGHIYVCWADYDDYPCTWSHFHAATHIGFTKSTTGGQPNSFVPNLNNPAALYNIPYNGIRYGTGALGEFNLTKVNDFPVMAVDRSCTAGPWDKRIYITYPEFDPIQPFPRKSRIVVIYSDDEGVNWTKGNQTNNIYGIVDVDGNQNWMPWITVDDATGNVYVAYLSAPSAPSGGIFPTDVFLAYSEDGGVTFNNIKVSDEQINPTPLPDPHSNPSGPFPEGYWGDYIALDAYGGNVYVAWMSNAHSNLAWQYNIFCSKVTVSTPLLYSSVQDLPINGPLSMTSTQNSILYQAVNSITTVANAESITIENGADVTFKAGNFIHFKPGSNSKYFGSLSGSKTHAFIAGVSPCTTPFRKGDYIKSNFGEIEGSLNNLKISPNPFTNIVAVNYFIFSDSKVSIQLFDAFGRRIIDIVNGQFTLSGEYFFTMNLQSYSNGIYYIKMFSDNNCFSKKIVKL